MRHLVEARHHGRLVDVVLSAFEQLIAVSESESSDVFLGGQTRQRLHLPVEGAVAHGHLVGDERQVDVLTHDVVAQQGVELLEEFLVEMTEG